MIDNQTLIKVTNRDNGSVGYVIPDLGNLHRNFEYNETKNLTMEELRKLSYIPGGKYLLENCLIVDNKQALEELFIDVEPEYFYTEEEVKTLLLTGSIDEFYDCLDFAPTGVIELVKSLAVQLQINDLAKREAILDKTGFDVSAAIIANTQTAELNEESNEKKRRAAPLPTDKTEKTESKYKNVRILNK